MFRNVFRSPSTSMMLASATAAFTGSSYVSSSSNETKCEQKPSHLPTFKGWRHRSDGTNKKLEMKWNGSY